MKTIATNNFNSLEQYRGNKIQRGKAIRKNGKWFISVEVKGKLQWK